MNTKEIEKLIVLQLNECDGSYEAPIGDGFYIAFYDEGDDFLKYGVAVGRIEENNLGFTEFQEYEHFLIGDYFDGNYGDMIFHGSNIIERMAEDICGVCKDYINEDEDIDLGIE